MFKIVTSNSTVIALHDRLYEKKNNFYVINSSSLDDKWFIDHKDFANNTIAQVQITLPEILAGTRLEKTTDIAQFKKTGPTRDQHAENLVQLLKQCGYIVKTFH